MNIVVKIGIDCMSFTMYTNCKIKSKGENLNFWTPKARIMKSNLEFENIMSSFTMTQALKYHLFGKSKRGLLNQKYTL